jgi:hypothetical protein
MEARFWARVQKQPSCWIWTGGHNGKQYGYVWVGKRKWLAHRLSWFLTRGEEPPRDMLVCHACDNPRCVRPDHLWLGTPQDNMDDKVAKGRSGIRSNKLTPEQRAKRAVYMKEYHKAYGARWRAAHPDYKRNWAARRRELLIGG